MWVKSRQVIDKPIQLSDVTTQVRLDKDIVILLNNIVSIDIAFLQKLAYTIKNCLTPRQISSVNGKIEKYLFLYETF